MIRSRNAIWFTLENDSKLFGLEYCGLLSKTGMKNRIRCWERRQDEQEQNHEKLFDCVCGKIKRGLCAKISNKSE